MAFSFNLYMDEIDSFLNAATESFAAVEVLDEHVVVIILSEAIPNLDSLLVGLPILPEHVWREHVDAAMEFENSDPVGSGPFMWAATDEELNTAFSPTVGTRSMHR